LVGLISYGTLSHQDDDELRKTISPSRPIPLPPSAPSDRRLCTPQEIVEMKEAASSNTVINADVYLDENNLDCVVGEEEEEEVEEAENAKQEMIQAFTIGLFVGVIAFVILLTVIECWRTGGNPASFAFCDTCRRCGLTVWAVMDRFHWLQEEYNRGNTPYVGVRTLMGHFGRRGAERLEEEEEEEMTNREGAQEGAGAREEGNNPSANAPTNKVSVTTPTTTTTTTTTTTPPDPAPTSKSVQDQDGEEESFVNATTTGELEDPDADAKNTGARRKRSLFSFLRPGPRGYERVAATPSSISESESTSTYKSAEETFPVNL
jgi:hypothetical protein